MLDWAVHMNENDHPPTQMLTDIKGLEGIRALAFPMNENDHPPTQTLTDIKGLEGIRALALGNANAKSKENLVFSSFSPLS